MEFITNNAENVGEKPHEITPNAYYNYKIWKCYNQIDVPNDLPVIQEIEITYNEIQWLRTGKANKEKAMKDYDDHPMVKQLKSRFTKAVLIHDCELVDQKEKVNFNINKKR